MIKISVIIPVYNQSRYIGQTLDAVKRQTFRDWECIIVNDGSIDNTEDIVNNYVNCDNRFKYIFQKNTGLSGARNTGILSASGVYIAFLDADDLWEPRMLETTYKFLEDHRDIGVVCTGWDLIDEYGNIKSRKFCPRMCNDYFESLILRNLFPVHTLLLKKEIFDRCGLFDIRLKSLEDWDMWLRVVQKGYKFSHTNQLLAHYRRHSNSMSINVNRMAENSFAVVEKFFNDGQNRNISWKKPYVLIFQYLLIAKENRRGLSRSEIRTYIEKAQAILNQTAYNPHYSLLFIKLAVILPDSDKFIAYLLRSTPIHMKPKTMAMGLMTKSIYLLLDADYLTSTTSVLSACILWPPIVIDYIRYFLKKIICV